MCVGRPCVRDAKRLRDVIFLAWCDWTLLIILSRCTFQKKGGLAEKSGLAEKKFASVSAQPQSHFWEHCVDSPRSGG